MVYNKILGISYDAVENPNRGKFQQKKKKNLLCFGSRFFFFFGGGGDLVVISNQIGTRYFS